MSSLFRQMRPLQNRFSGPKIGVSLATRFVCQVSLQSVGICANVARKRYLITSSLHGNSLRLRLVTIMMTPFYVPAPRVGGIKRWCASDVYLTSVCRVHRA